MNKTADLEFAIKTALGRGPLTIGGIFDLPILAEIRAEDSRWIYVALMNLAEDGVIRFPNCDVDSGHDHTNKCDHCPVELAR